MRRTPLAVLLLCLAVLPPLHANDRRGKRPAGERAPRRTCSLATLSARQARRLHGRLATYRVTLATDDDREGKWDVYGCKSEDAGERTLWLPGCRCEPVLVSAALGHPRTGPRNRPLACFALA
jgi:hypothetical protein